MHGLLKEVENAFVRKKFLKMSVLHTVNVYMINFHFCVTLVLDRGTDRQLDYYGS
jgi:hypothetical protein